MSCISLEVFHPIISLKQLFFSVFTHSVSFGRFNLHASQYQTLSLSLRNFLLKCFFDFRCSSYIFNDVHRYFGQALHDSFAQTSDCNKRKLYRFNMVCGNENRLGLKDFICFSSVHNTCSFRRVVLE